MQLLAHRSRNHWYPRRTGCVRGRKEVRQYRRADSFLQYCPHNGHLVFAKLAVAFRKSMPIAYKGKYLFSIRSVRDYFDRVDGSPDVCSYQQPKNCQGSTNIPADFGLDSYQSEDHTRQKNEYDYGNRQVRRRHKASHSHISTKFQCSSQSYRRENPRNNRSFLPGFPVFSILYPPLRSPLFPFINPHSVAQKHSLYQNKYNKILQR